MSVRAKEFFGLFTKFEMDYLGVKVCIVCAGDIVYLAADAFHLGINCGANQSLSVNEFGGKEEQFMHVYNRAIVSVLCARANMLSNDAPC